MSAANLAVRQVRYENKAFWRNPAAAFFTFIFPLLFLVIFNLAFGNDEVQRGEVTTNLATIFIIPGITAFSIITACYTNIAMGITISRDEGVLKRKRGTPLPSWAFMFGRIGHAVIIGLLLVAIVVVAGTAFYEVDVPGTTLPAFLVTLAVGAASFCALGLAISTVTPNAEAAPAIVNATILPLLFISGVFIRIEDPPTWLRWVADFFPIKHFQRALRYAFDPITAGSGFRWADLAVVAAWGVFGAVIATRFFSWEPRR